MQPLYPPTRADGLLLLHAVPPHPTGNLGLSPALQWSAVLLIRLGESGGMSEEQLWVPSSGPRKARALRAQFPAEQTRAPARFSLRTEGAPSHAAARGPITLAPVILISASQRLQDEVARIAAAAGVELEVMPDAAAAWKRRVAPCHAGWRREIPNTGRKRCWRTAVPSLADWMPALAAEWAAAAASGG